MSSERNKEKATTCPKCSRKFHNPSNLKVHLRSHAGDAPFACAHCDATFTTRANKLRHERTRHLGEKRFACDECGKKFTEEKSVRVHIRTVHLKEKQHKCEECGKYFAQRGSLHTHRSRCKRQDTSHICEVCGEQFQFKKQLMAHLQLHEDAKSWSVDHESQEITPNVIKQEIDVEHNSKVLVPENDDTSINEVQSEINDCQLFSQPDNTKSDSSQQNTISQHTQQDDDEQCTKICENKDSKSKHHRKCKLDNENQESEFLIHKHNEEAVIKRKMLIKKHKYKKQTEVT